VTIEPGMAVVLMDEQRTTEGRVLTVGASGTLVGYEGERYVVEVDDHVTGQRLTVVTDRWNVRRLAPRLVR